VLISNAFAQAAAGTPDNTGAQVIFFLLMCVVMFFLIIRPQQKKAKEQAKLIASLAKGDEIVTQGGVAGRITKLGENYITLEIATIKDGTVEIAVQKQAVSNLLPKGTLKTL